MIKVSRSIGLGAGMCDALGLGDVLDHATHHNPAMRDLTGGEAGTAMVRNGLGCINQTHIPHPVPHFRSHFVTAQAYQEGNYAFVQS
jgi:hypothetical protein